MKKKHVAKAKTSVKSNAKSQKSEFSVFKKKYRRGDYAKIAKTTGYDPAHVRRVLHGEAGNPSGVIMKIARQMFAKR